MDKFFSERFSNSPPPTKKDMLRLAKQLGVGAVFDCNLHGHILGLTQEEGDVVVIYIEKQQGEPEKLLTLMHELNHVMEARGLKEIGRTDDCDRAALRFLTGGLASEHVDTQVQEWPFEHVRGDMPYVPPPFNGAGYG